MHLLCVNGATCRAICHVIPTLYLGSLADPPHKDLPTRSKHDAQRRGMSFLFLQQHGASHPVSYEAACDSFALQDACDGRVTTGSGQSAMFHSSIADASLK